MIKQANSARYSIIRSHERKIQIGGPETFTYFYVLYSIYVLYKYMYYINIVDGRTVLSTRAINYFILTSKRKVIITAREKDRMIVAMYR